MKGNGKDGCTDSYGSRHISRKLFIVKENISRFVIKLLKKGILLQQTA